MPERILIVEDEEKIARFVELELMHEGYLVDKAVNGREGLSAAQNGGYDLMLLDIMLPELSGFEVLRRRGAFGENTSCAEKVRAACRQYIPGGQPGVPGCYVWRAVPGRTPSRSVLWRSGD